MTAEREEIIRHGYRLWNEGDYESLEGLFHPDASLDATRRVLNPAHYEGIEGLRRLTQETFEVWEAWTITPTRFFWSDDGDCVLVETLIEARGRSGVALSGTYYTVWRIRDEMVAAMELHVDVDEAFGAAGIEREAS